MHAALLVDYGQYLGSSGQVSLGYAAAMAKERRVYVCERCGAGQPKWQGQCPECGAWNTLSELAVARPRPDRGQYAGQRERVRLDRLEVGQVRRIGTGLKEFDRVLGGGLVPGSVVLIGGEPGIGKSTLLLSAAGHLAAERPTCYLSGEESLDQIGLRAGRLGIASAPLWLMAETQVESVLAQLQSERPEVLIVDSIQTLVSEQLDSAPGSVTQLRETAAQLVRFAKAKGVATILVGHVTKEGTLAGPRLLEHMVDTVLYFESDSGTRFRMVRAVKNRFGAANETGFFVMGEGGFKEVKNPSAIFLSRSSQAVPGSLTLVTREGTRSVLVEIQALVDRNSGSHPRRVALGSDVQRLGLLLAVLHQHCGIAAGDADVFVNVVGGLRVHETASDLALALAVASSVRARPLPTDTAVFGEVGLTGEIRPVPYGEERLAEAVKHGFRQIVLPVANCPRQGPAEARLVPVERLSDAVRHLLG
jgi:DNA repair protein RadA/Sms